MIHETGRRPGARGLVVVTAMTMCGMVPMLGSVAPAQADGPVLPRGGDTTRPKARPKVRAKARTSTARVRSGKWRPVRTNIVLTTRSPASPVLYGRTYSWSYTVTNTRTVARTVRFSAVMPQGVGFVSAQHNCSIQAGQVVCDLGTMQAGETRTGVVSGKIITQESGRPIDMNGVVSGTVVKQVRAGQPKAVRWGSVVTQRPFPRVMTAATADVSVSKSAPARVSPGGTITYKITLRNHGPATAQNVVLTDMVLSRAAVTVAKGNVACTLKEAASRGSAGNGGAPAVRAGFVCAVGAMAPGQAKKLTLGVQVGSAARPGSVVKAPARVTTSTPESTTANNSAEARTRVVAPSAARLAAAAQRPARSSGSSSSSSEVPSKASTEQGAIPSVGMSQLPRTGEPTARLIAISLGMVIAGAGMLGAGAYRRRTGGGTGGKGGGAQTTTTTTAAPDGKPATPEA